MRPDYPIARHTGRFADDPPAPDPYSPRSIAWRCVTYALLGTLFYLTVTRVLPSLLEPPRPMELIRHR